MENINTAVQGEDKICYSTTTLSVRRTKIEGLPGYDGSMANTKIGSSLKGSYPLRGLDFEEEDLYLPNIINTDPKDVRWRAMVENYWNDISEKVPSDMDTADKEIQGRLIKFTVRFKKTSHKAKYETILKFEDQVAFIKEHGIVVEGIADYILFRYCLVYGRVANNYKDIHKSPKIKFYLYSKALETKSNFTAMKKRTQATALFNTYLDPEKSAEIDAVLLMFQDDISLHKSFEDKILALEGYSKGRPEDFVAFANDPNLNIKAGIRQAVDLGIIHQPANTDSYYYGDDESMLLGSSLKDAVMFFKSGNENDKQVIQAIMARLKHAKQSM